jgi:hypothetical protein
MSKSLQSAKRNCKIDDGRWGVGVQVGVGGMNKTFLGFDTQKCWDYENGFYLTSHVTRLAKVLAHYELYKSIVGLPGHVIECGVYKGASFLRLATFRELLESPHSRRIIGFDIFGRFPESNDRAEQEFIQRFSDAGGDGITCESLNEVLAYKGFSNIELVPGDICVTVPEYVETHPELKIALLHIDVDVYEPTRIILNELAGRVVKGGLIVLDDYGTVSGETRAVDEFIKVQGSDLTIEKLPISHIPAYVRK